MLGETRQEKRDRSRREYELGDAVDISTDLIFFWPAYLVYEPTLPSFASVLHVAVNAWRLAII